MEDEDISEALDAFSNGCTDASTSVEEGDKASAATTIRGVISGLQELLKEFADEVNAAEMDNEE